MSESNYIRLFSVILLFSCSLFSQAQKKERIADYRADINRYNKNVANGARRLIGNASFNHGGALMHCDSAYFYSKENTFDAYDNVFINQGDTIHIFGNFLHYDGNYKLAKIIGDVRLINTKQNTTLTTDELEYNIDRSIGYYTNHANIISGENTLESIIGYYYSRSKTFHFRDSVVIVNPDYTIYSDTVHYNTESDIAYFFGPTDIIGDSSHIYGEYGWYDTKKDLSEIKINAWAKNPNQTVKGEYIYYNKHTGDGKARNQVEIIDNDQNIILLGNDAIYNEITEFAYITDSAQFLQFTEEDTLYLHADSLKTFADTNNEKILQAYNKVKFYRENVQGKCDSLVYTFSDSVAKMFYEPVLWKDENQISAEQIDMYTKNEQLYKIELYRSAFMTSLKDSNSFDQIKGNHMTVFLTDGQLDNILVKGKGQTIYYAEDGPDIVGVNKIRCGDMILYFVKEGLNDIKFYDNPEGILYPLDKIPENEIFLKGFLWRDTERPKDKKDIF